MKQLEASTFNGRKQQSACALASWTCCGASKCSGKRVHFGANSTRTYLHHIHLNSEYHWTTETRDGRHDIEIGPPHVSCFSCVHFIHANVRVHWCSGHAISIMIHSANSLYIHAIKMSLPFSTCYHPSIEWCSGHAFSIVNHSANGLYVIYAIKMSHTFSTCYHLMNNRIEYRLNRE